MENKIKEIPNYQTLSEKLYEVVKGETFNDVNEAVKLLMSNLRHRSIVK